jgi:hypothetical protein
MGWAVVEQGFREDGTSPGEEEEANVRFLSRKRGSLGSPCIPSSLNV